MPPAPRDPDAPAALSGSRVLVVDDDLASLDLLCGTLEADGCTVLVATSGELALVAAARSRPNLILLDVRMTGMDGVETCRRLREHNATAAIPIVLLSADDADRTRRAALQAGAIGYLVKRPPWEDVIARIRGHLVDALRAQR